MTINQTICMETEKSIDSKNPQLRPMILQIPSPSDEMSINDLIQSLNHTYLILDTPLKVHMN